MCMMYAREQVNATEHLVEVDLKQSFLSARMMYRQNNLVEETWIVFSLQVGKHKIGMSFNNYDYYADCPARLLLSSFR